MYQAERLATTLVMQMAFQDPQPFYPEISERENMIGQWLMEVQEKEEAVDATVIMN